jgi:hypothetical protein
MSAMDTTTINTRRDGTATAVAALAGLGALGSALMTIAHLGVEIPGLAGPGRLILPAAILFGVGTVLFVMVALGILRRATWAWPVAVVVNGLAFVSAVVPIRGAISFVAGGITLLAVVLLVTRQGRAALLPRDQGAS